jgi:formylglycine-generating enzyme required for sulfatase activity
VLVIGLSIALVLLAAKEVERKRADQNAKETEAALVEVTTERNEKQQALTAKTAALSDYDRLGDLSRLQRLQAEAAKLWPSEPTKVEGMKAWVDQGAALAERLGGHVAFLAEVRESGRRVARESRQGESQPAESGSIWLFASDAEQFKHDTTVKLVADLTAFADPDPAKGLLANVRKRLAFAESVERETIGKYENEWADAIRSIASVAECPQYAGLRIRPQLGLIPIAKNPSSGLWEFAHLETATATDPVPKRGADGKLIVTESMGLVFVLLPGGMFRMGAVKPDEDTPPTGPNVDPDAIETEAPVNDVTLDAFFMSKYEMTQAQWLRLVGKNPSCYAPGERFGDKVVNLLNPVEQVSWEDCDLWLGRLGLVLPTEAQWEYAARGGTTTPRWTGIGKDGLAKAANLADAFCRQHGGRATWTYESWDDGFTAHAPAGSFAANPFGLHDVLGNVLEWCRDRFGGYHHPVDPGDGLRRNATARNRVLRGGGYFNDASIARSAFRFNYPPEIRDNYIGVRPARSISSR